MLQGYQYSDQASRSAGSGPRTDGARGSLGLVKLQFLALLLLIVMVGLSGWIFYESRAARWDSVARTDGNLVRALDRDISRNLTLYDLSLLSVRRRMLLPELATLSPETRQRVLFDGADQALKFGAIEVLDRNGWVVSASRSSMMLPANAAGASYFQYHRATHDDDLRLEMRQQDGPDGPWQLVLTRRIVDAAGTFDGVVRGSIDIALFQDLFDTMDIGAGGLVSLFMRDGTVVARTGTSSVLGTRVDLKHLVPDGPAGSFMSTSPIDGVTRFFSFHRLADFPLDVSVGVPEDVIDGPWRTEARIVALVLAMLVAASIVLLFIVRREFRRRGAAEGEAADAAAKYRLVADHVTDIISKTTLDGTRTYVSPAYSRILGFDPAEIVGTKAVDFAFADDVPRVAGALEICIAGMGRASCVYRARHRDGHWLWVEASHQAVRNETGKIVEIVSAVRDITLQKQAAEELASKTGMLDAILANMPDGVCLFDTALRMVAWNVQLWEILDLDRGAILGSANPTEAYLRSMVERGDFGDTDVDECVRIQMASIASSDRLQRRHQTVSGKWVELRATRMPDGGKLSIWRDVDQEVRHELDLREAYEQVGRQITLQEQAAEELARKTGMLDAILANMPDGVCLFDPQQRIVTSNAQLWEILDLDRATILGAPNPSEAFLRRMAERGDYGRVDVEAMVRQRLASIASGEHKQQRRPTVSGKWVELRATPMPDGGSLSIYRDVDQEVRRELDLREAYEQVGRQASDLAAIAEQAEAAQIEAEAARTAADEASRAKSDFLASMSHEIRTPMSGILGFSDLLLDSPLDGEQQRLVRLLRDAGKGLLTIINDILDVSKIEAGKLQLESIPISVASVADGALSMVRPQADAKQLLLTIAVAPDVPTWVLGDPTRLRQILLNLLSNAVKFTERGTVCLSVRRESIPPDELHTARPSATAGTPIRLVLAVTDTGIGIDPGQQSLLFQNFQQVDASTTRKYGGTGLGLAISRNLVEAMGGTIGVESEEGTGSTFHFRLDVYETDPPVELLAPVAGRSRSNPARILVAEDLDMNQLIVQRMLETAGHEVTIVANGAEALEALRHTRFDLVLMDMEMPIMNGLAAAEAIRGSSGSFRSVPIIALTANSMASEVDRCHRAGMDGHLSKPIDRALLLDTIDRWMATGAAPTEELPSLSVTSPVTSPLISDCAGEAEAAEETDPAVLPAPVPILDLDLLVGLERRIGAEQVAKFADMFREQLGKTMAALASARDSATIAAEAHILISLAGNLGLNELMQAARALMNAARRQSPEMAALAVGLADVAARASTAINTRYPSLVAA